MRGTVTLATALALPTGGNGVAPFPYRDLIVVTAFGVVLGTLVLQGLTLRPVLLRLRLKDDGTVDREVRFARVETLRAALDATGSYPDAEAAAIIRHRYEFALRRAQEELSIESSIENGPVDETASAIRDEAAVQAATEAQRRRLVALRANGTIGDTAFQRVEEELDWTELDWAQLVRAGQRAGRDGR